MRDQPAERALPGGIPSGIKTYRHGDEPYHTIDQTPAVPVARGDKEIQKSAMETIFLADFLMQFSSARISFSPDNFSYMISANPYLLKIAIKNILSNACKYSDDKSVEMRLRGSVLTISDRGIGIPPEELKRIFQPFTGRAIPGNTPGMVSG